MATMALAQGIIIWLSVPEPRNKSLEEMESYWATATASSETGKAAD